jgi:hypothetical protein
MNMKDLTLSKTAKNSDKLFNSFLKDVRYSVKHSGNCEGDRPCEVRREVLDTEDWN